MEDYIIEIQEKEVNQEPAKVLLVNGKEQSVSYIKNKNELASLYSIEIMNIVSKLSGCNILLLGGGGFSIPKYFISHFTDGKMVVIEKSEQIYDVAMNHFYLSDLIEEYDILHNQRLKIHIMDAIEYLETTHEMFDVIINDAYDAGEMVAALLEKDCVKGIVNHLNEGGLYIQNFFSALEGIKRKAWDEQKEILDLFFSKSTIQQVDVSLPMEHRQNCIVVSKK